MAFEDAVIVTRALTANGCDLVDVSTGGDTPLSKPIFGRMSQVPFADRIRAETGTVVMTVGAIESIDHANTVIGADRSDLCAIARGHSSDPYLSERGAIEPRQHASLVESGPGERRRMRSPGG